LRRFTVRNRVADNGVAIRHDEWRVMWFMSSKELISHWWLPTEIDLRDSDMNSFGL
jgi:hypothetical protein